MCDLSILLIFKRKC